MTTDTITLCMGFAKDELLQAVMAELNTENIQETLYTILAYCNDPAVVVEIERFHSASIAEDPRYLKRRATFEPFWRE